MTDIEKTNNIDLEQINSGLDDEDFVYTQVTGDDGSVEIVGGGYKVNSFFLKAGMPINSTSPSTFDSIQDGGKKVSTPFENLAVPAGLYYINQKVPKMNDVHYEPHKVVPDDLFDKLFALVDGHKKSPKKTRKHRVLKDTTIKAITGKRKTKRSHPSV